jgi:tetratricopeptide (TPR) repeat protein
MADLAHLTGDIERSEAESDWLVTHAPEDRINWVNWIASASTKNLFALAIQRVRLYLERWPNHPETEFYRTELARLEDAVCAQLDLLGLVRDDRLELAAESDVVQHLVNCEKYEEAIEQGRAALETDPEFIQIRTSVADALLELSQVDEAATEYRRVLRQVENYVFALDGLVRCSVLLGQMQEARSNAHKMAKSCAALRPYKCTRALAIAGDYPAVIDLVQSLHTVDDDTRRELMHLEAVAHARSGNLHEAQSLWKEILKRDPDHKDVRANLNDSRAPAGKQNGAWVFDLEEILPARMWPEMKMRIATSLDSDTFRDEILSLVEGYPFLRNMIPWFLEHGEPSDRTVLMALAAQLPANELAADLLTFARGRFGTDDHRMSTYRHLLLNEVIPRQQQPFWSKGEIISTTIIGFKISTDHGYHFPPDIMAIVEASEPYIDSNDGERFAEGMLKAIAIAPTSPVLRNNLASAYRMSGDEEQFKRIITDLYRDYPDYHFARTNMAIIHLADGDFDAARMLLTPLYEKSTLTISELHALCTTTLQLALFSGNLAEAETWIRMWEECEPGLELMLEWKQKIEKARQQLPRHN